MGWWDLWWIVEDDGWIGGRGEDEYMTRCWRKIERLWKRRAEGKELHLLLLLLVLVLVLLVLLFLLLLVV